MKIYKKNGFAILYAVLVTTVIVAVGLIMSNVTTKQIILSTTGRDSQKAFYAANAGLECALYEDLNFSFGLMVSGSYMPPPDGEIECNGRVIEISDGIGTNGFYKDNITIEFSDSMAIVSVLIDADNTVPLIISKGYNSTNLSGSRLVERSIRSDAFYEL